MVYILGTHMSNKNPLIKIQFITILSRHYIWVQVCADLTQLVFIVEYITDSVYGWTLRVTVPINGNYEHTGKCWSWWVRCRRRL